MFGILGGVGPAATARLHMLIIEEAAKQGACNDAEYPPLIILAPRFTLTDPTGCSAASKDEVSQMTTRYLMQLASYGADRIAIACNSIHFDTIAVTSALEEKGINFYHLPQLVTAQLTPGRYLLLASETTYREGLYESAGDIKIVYPNDEQHDVTKAIEEAMRLDIEAGWSHLNSVITRNYNNNIDAVILGCTELSFYLPKMQKISVIDSLTSLAQTIVRSQS